MGIQYLSYHQIDQQKWDSCINEAQHSLIYASSFYLNSMAKHWDALVMNDYEAVMPLTWNKKMGIAYLYMPPFIQQLGIFSKDVAGETIKELFVTTARQRYRFAELSVNFNCGEEQPDFILPLNRSYQLIEQGYKNDLRKNLKQAARWPLRYLPSDDVTTAVQIYRDHYASRTPHIKERDYKNFTTVCETAQKHSHLLIRKVVDDSENILAMALLLKDKKRMYNVMSTVTAVGRQCKANHYLFDQMVQEFSGQNLVLDFEGSSIEGIASFYQNFGAVNEPYYFLRYNHLPWPIKYFK